MSTIATDKLTRSQYASMPASAHRATSRTRCRSIREQESRKSLGDVSGKGRHVLFLMLLAAHVVCVCVGIS
jgi:hypothetical protein